MLADKVHIARRFQRAIRIDTDINHPAALEGFICPQSSADVLLSMAHHVLEVDHGAFIWTGPYGSGKSSLVVALSALLSGKKALSDSAVKAIGKRTANAVLASLPPKKSGWSVIPIVGRRENPIHVIGEALVAGKYARKPRGSWTESKLIEKLNELASQNPRSTGGVILFIDEMGKFLEGAAQNGSDVFIFQQLAEAASRSNGRLLLVGVLHQAFEEYANKLSREQRDEWSKIQGRFIDLPVNMAGEEQLNLISCAIETKKPNSKRIESVAKSVAKFIREQRPAASSRLEKVLVDCWPLHPVVACLLGPISRRRFGQNQRSIFGFLNSAEPQGLQDFLRDAKDDELYTPVRLWDYLRYNLESSILSSPDGHRWSLAMEALQRCEALESDPSHLMVLKNIALIDMFRERSGLSASENILFASCGLSRAKLKETLHYLRKKSLVIFRKFANDYAVFAGSDFDIESAVDRALADLGELEFSAIKRIADIQPILAKRHYHKTGVLRWFDVDLVPVSELQDVASQYEPEHGTIGQFILTVPTEGETDISCRKAAKNASELGKDWDIVAGVSTRSWAITDLTRELLALEHIQANNPELAGDSVARREVNARSGDVQNQLEDELQKAFDNADWYCKGDKIKGLIQAELNSLASDLASGRFNQSPVVFNELLNRIKPSGSAVAAQNLLLRGMVMNEGEPRLGIEGFPAEGGLFASLLEATGLYAADGDTLALREPPRGKKDNANLHPIWKAATDHLKKNNARAVPVSELYDIWRKAPFGVRDGLMPVLVVAYMLSRRESLAFYRQEIFQGRLRDLDMDYLTKDAGDIQLRWMDLSEISRRLLSEMAEVVRKLDQTNTLAGLAPIDVARGLIAIYVSLPPWTQKTMRLSKNAIQIRQIFKNAKDPNKFLFDDLPESLARGEDVGSEASVHRIVKSVHEGLEELCEAYPTMLHRMRDVMLAELQVPNIQPQSLQELRERAKNIKELMGDLRLDAFASRLAEFDGSDEHVEGLASLATSKPARDWSDMDIDRAAIELTAFAQKFVRSEAFARVKGRTDKRHAMAVVVGINGRPTPIAGEFDIMDKDRAKIDQLVGEVEKTLEKDKAGKRNLVLAALAELSARYLEPAKQKKKDKQPARGGKLL